MSPTSNAIERLAQRHGVPPLAATEYFLERLDIRAGDESAALADLEVWARLWVVLKGEPGPQMSIRGVR